jgi:hypothetical protein
MPKRRSPRVVAPALFDLEPESTKQEAPAPSFRKDADQFVEQLMYSLTAPYIGYPGWGDDPSFWEPHKAKVTMERMLHHQEIHRDKMASEYETALYLSSATLAHPMSHDWAQMYFYLFTTAMPEQAKVIGNEVTELDPGQREELARLRRWIFRQQMAHLRAKRKAAENGTPAPAPAVVEDPVLPRKERVEQPKIF